MLFSYAVRALYIESSSMFVRGGVYRVVKEAMGGTLAKFSVSSTCLPSRKRPLQELSPAWFFFAMFTCSEHRVAQERRGKPENFDQFRTYGEPGTGQWSAGGASTTVSTRLVVAQSSRLLRSLITMNKNYSPRQ